MTVNIVGGAPLFTITGDLFSRSHRRTVMDASSSTKLFQVRKDGLGGRHYYAEVSENGPKLFTMEIRKKLFHRPTAAVRFTNQADSGRTEVTMEYIPAIVGDNGSFTYNGQVVAVIEKRMSLGGEYHLTIASGLDPAVVVGVTIAMIDRAKD